MLNPETIQASSEAFLETIYEMVKLVRSKECSPEEGLESLGRLRMLVERNMVKDDLLKAALEPLLAVCDKAKTDIEAVLSRRMRGLVR